MRNRFGCYTLALLAATHFLAGNVSAEVVLEKFYATSPADLADISPGDGKCSAVNAQQGEVCTLRAAIMEANATPGVGRVDVILVPGMTYEFSIAGRNENSSKTGDLDIARKMRVGVPSSSGAKSRINAAYLDRAFHILDGADGSELVGLEIFNGLNGAGAAIDSLSSDVDIDHCDIHKNRGKAGEPVAVVRHAAAGYMRIVDSRIHHNATDADIPLSAVVLMSGSLVVERSSIDSNNGKGIDAQQTEADFLFVRNSTIAKNSSSGVLIGTVAAVDSATIVDNLRQVSFFGEGARLQLNNSVLIGESVVCTSRQAGTLFVADYNIYSDASCISDNVNDHSHHEAKVVGFSAFGNWGGPTPTYKPLAGSVAIDLAPASFCEGADQRGQPRPLAYMANPEPRCDTGAVELYAVPPLQPWTPRVFRDEFEDCEGC